LKQENLGDGMIEFLFHAPFLAALRYARFCLLESRGWV
jgi:hypothetical protein